MRVPSDLHASARLIGLRIVFAMGVAALLVAGIVGGLLRAGVAVPVWATSAWSGQAVVAHAFLMICGFMGTVIGIERAVAVKSRLAYVGPVLSAVAGLGMLGGYVAPASWLGVVAAVSFVAVNVVVVGRQRAPHTSLLLTGAVAWLVGNVLHATGGLAFTPIPWWFSFLVLTIAAERLEMTRLMRRRHGAATLLYVCLGAMLSGSALFALSPVWGGALYGASLVGLAAWLIAYDIARRTIVAHGLSRYMAVCLLLGYGWLGIAGGAWVSTSIGLPARDIALHALGLGFIFSMMLGHAPVILPALARVKLLFGWFFYVPVILLHGSLIVRLCAGSAAFTWLSIGAAGNALAIALFAMTMAGSVVAWRMRHQSHSSRQVHANH